MFINEIFNGNGIGFLIIDEKTNKIIKANGIIKKFVPDFDIFFNLEFNDNGSSLLKYNAKQYLVVKKKSSIFGFSGICYFVIDKTLDLSKKEELEQKAQILNEILDSLDIAIFWKDIKHRVQGANHRFLNYLNFTDINQIKGKTEFDIFPSNLAKHFLDTDLQAINADKLINYKEIELGITEKEIVMDVSKVPLKKDGKITGILCYLQDITQQHFYEKKIKFISCHDDLTGLYNRNYFSELQTSYIIKDKIPLSIVMIDTNGLKIINDTFGHEAGDESLQKISEVISQNIRSIDIPIRMGGDEFSIIFPNTDIEEAGKIMKHIKKEIAKNKVNCINLSISYGISVKLNETESINEVLYKADGAMYQNKMDEKALVRKQIIDNIMSNLFMIDPSEKDHSEKVKQLVKVGAEALGLIGKKQKDLELLAYFHDIGKIMLDLNVFQKKEKLAQSDWEEIRKHVELGTTILKASDEYFYLAESLRHHHEHFDGTGYPSGLKGNSIPYFSRIIAVADAIVAMESDRPYRKAYSKDYILKELKDKSGTQFDPKIAEIFIKIIEEHR